MADNQKKPKKRQVLILGGGFGGVKAALALAESPAYELTLISDQENFRYYPMLYHSATGGSQAASSIPLGEIFQDKSINVVLDSAESIDREQKKVKTKNGNDYPYDILIIALGVVTNFFGIKGLDKYAYGIKTLEEAHRLRDHLHKLLLDEQKPDINYVVIGGGPTGVELAGALPAYIRRIMKNHDIRGKGVHIDLVEAAPRLLPRMPKPYSRAVQRRLRRLGVHLYLGQTVQAQTAEELVVSGHEIDSHTVVWTAGVTNHPFLKANGFMLSDDGRVIVDQYLQAEHNIYVVGDNADTPYSGMAQTALRDGLFVGRNLVRMAEGQAPEGYNPQKPIYITPVGPRWAAVLWGRTQIYGFGGWVLRLLADLVGYHDLEPLLPASKHWLAQADNQESCAICFGKEH